MRIDIDKEPARTGGDEVLEILGEPPSEKNGNIGSKRWMHCQVRAGKFDAAGDTTQLRNIIRCFRDMVSSEGRAWREGSKPFPPKNGSLMRSSHRA